MARQLTRFLETYRGSSFPTRSELEDGSTCVVKMRGAGNGSTALLSEFVVNRLAQAAGLPVPAPQVVEIAAGFPWEFGTDEFHDLVQKSPGPNLGLAWIEGARPVPAADYNSLPHELVSQVVTLDLAFANWDRPVRSGNLLEDRRGRRWIVDHGSCRFLFQPTSTDCPLLPPDHAFSGWEEMYDERWLRPIETALVAEVVAEIPELWLSEAQLTRDAVTRAIGEAVAGRKRTAGPMSRDVATRGSEN